METLTQGCVAWRDKDCYNSPDSFVANVDLKYLWTFEVLLAGAWLEST